MIVKRWKLMNTGTQPDWTLIGIISGNRVYNLAIEYLWPNLSFLGFTVNSMISYWPSSLKHCSRRVPILSAFGFRRMIAAFVMGLSDLSCVAID